MSSSTEQYVLVTGATGFIGAHIVDALLAKGNRVRGATRTMEKGNSMIKNRPQYLGRLDFVQIDDFESPGGLDDAVKDVDAIIHTASPFTYDTTNNEKELIIPAINGVKAIIAAAAASPRIRRVVLTSSFASVLDAARRTPPYFTYTSADWNPLSYAEAADPHTSAVVAYRGSKKFAELAAWDFVDKEKPQFDLVTLCPPMTFGPVVHPVPSVDHLNESNAMLWKIAKGESPLPVSRVPFWVDVRDLAAAHVGALTSAKGSKRYTVASPQRFTYGMAADIISNDFPEIQNRVARQEQPVDESYGLDGETAAHDFGFEYRSFRETVHDLVAQALKMPNASA